MVILKELQYVTCKEMLKCRCCRSWTRKQQHRPM